MADEEKKSERKVELEKLHKEGGHAFWGKASWSEARAIVGESLTYEKFCDEKVKHWTEMKKAGLPKVRTYIPKATTAEEAADLKKKLDAAKARADAMAARIKEYEDSQKGSARKK